MYAILDIETTGGQFNEEGITEIAIYKYDGHEVVDQFISLVNPEIPIQPFVVKLTGINNAMLQTAPKFFEVAKRIIEITQDCILVAHNATFDYRILRTEFRRLGYDFQAQTLCTVELAQKLIPEQPSYSLGKLVRALGIPMADRHRAGGDALATVKLFKLLLEKDLEKVILKELIKTEVEKGIAPKLLDIIESLPSKTGIYYIHGENGDILFVGQSRNIKKRVNQHFTGSDSKSKKIQALVFTVSYEETGSEIIAMLKEIEEIKILKPVLNRLPTRLQFGYALYENIDHNGYSNLSVQKADRRKSSITAFGSLAEGRNTLRRLAGHFSLCQKLTGLQETEDSCSLYEVGLCDGACIGAVSPAEYNVRIQNLIDKIGFSDKNLMIIDRGRNISERSAIVFEDGVFKGYAYYDLNYQITNISVLKNILVPMQNHSNTSHLIQSWLHKSKNAKILRF